MAEVLINGLDARNPLFLQNNDHSNVPIVSIRLTGTDNYKMWSTAMKIALARNNKMRFFNVYSEIAFDVWEELQETYDKMDGSVIFNRPLPDVKKAFNVVSREESHRGLNPGSRSSSGSKVHPAAFIVKSNNFKEIRLKGCYEIIEYHAGFKRNPNLIRQGLNLTVGRPNGTHAKITGIGNLRLTANVLLFDVLVVLEYCISLLSVHKLIKDSKLFVGFDEHKCYIQDLNQFKTVGTGSESGGLYLIDVEQNGKSVVGLSNYAFVCYMSRQLWHSRLGHPSDQVLSILSKSIGLRYDNHISPYDICHKAKKTMDHFPLSDHKFVFVGDLAESELNLLNFFDNTNGDSLKKPNDDEKDQSSYDGNVMDSKNIDSSHPVDNEAIFAAQIDENVTISEGNKSCSNDPSNKKYGIEKHVNLSKLYAMNLCFASNLNKSCEPKDYHEAALDKNWVEAMNNKMEAFINDYSLLVKNDNGVVLALLVYVDDIVVTGNNFKEIVKFRHFLSSKFQIKDLGSLKYFLGIEVLENKNGLYLSQRKYCLELLCEYGLLSCKPAATPMQHNVSSHFSAGLRVLRYLKQILGSVKKQATLSRSSAEAEYRCMASTTCETIWIVNLLKDLNVDDLLPVPLYSDSTSARGELGAGSD
ncbi:ribonuclease H-like domain-containing protein [Tanacetum coccineum]